MSVRTVTPVGSLLGAAVAIALSGSCMLQSEGTAPLEGSGGSVEPAGEAAASGGPGTTGGGAQAGNAGAGGAGSAQTGAAGSATSDAGGKPPEPEDCYDGDDNDADGLVDCEDSDCTPTSECVAEPPVGWLAVRSYEEPYPPAAAAPSCPSGASPIELFADPAGTPSCEPCSCSWMGAACSAPKLACWYHNVTCWFDPAVIVQSDYGGCAPNPPVPSTSAIGSCRLSAPPQILTQGECTASGGTLVEAEPWGRAIHACPVPAAGKGCGEGAACLPRSAAPYDTLCLLRDGQDACPAGFQTVDVQAFADGIDSRTCTPCACSTASVTCVGGGYVVHDDDDCKKNPNDKAITSYECTDASWLLDNGKGSFTAFPAEPTKGTCAGGMPGGQLQPVGPKKLCCLAPEP